MTVAATFAAWLAATVVHLALVVWTGLKAKRVLHIPLVIGLVVCLVITILFAERLGRGYDLDSAGWITPVHLALAKITTFAYLLPIVTGIRTLKDPKRRKGHRQVVFLVLALTLLTFATGTWMILVSERLPG